MQEDAAHRRFTPSARGRVVRLAGYAIGIALLVAAVWLIVRHRDLVAQSLGALAGAPWWMVALTLAGPGVNWLLTTLVFWVLLNGYGRVGRREMAALMAASWLLNHLPMRAGLVGRLAYHRLVNNISAVKVGRSLVDSIICSAAALGVSLVVVLGVVAASRGETHPRLGGAAPLAVGLLGLAGLGVSLVVRGRGSSAEREPAPALWRYMCGASLRTLDGVVWAARYWLVFRMLDAPISPDGAMAIAVVSQAAGLLPVPLGLREWAVGLTSSLLPGKGAAGGRGSGGGGGVLTGVVSSGGLVADVIMRVTELAWAVPTGTLSAWWLWRRYRSRGRSADTSSEVSDKA